MTKIKLISKTLAISLIPFVRTVSAFTGKDDVSSIRLIVACEVAEAVVIAGLFFGLGAWIF
jgi:hypothetical protein